MINRFQALGASAILFVAATAPALANDSLTLKSDPAADAASKVIAIVSLRGTAARLINAAPIDMPSFETISHYGGSATILVYLNADGSLANAAVLRSSGRTRVDESALRAVRASTYQAATIDGLGVAGRYTVEAVMDAPI